MACSSFVKIILPLLSAIISKMRENEFLKSLLLIDLQKYRLEHKSPLFTMGKGAMPNNIYLAISPTKL